MKRKKRFAIIHASSVLLIVIAFINIRFNFVIIPTNDIMVERQIDFITINTVFIGFSFTALGLLLGLSSEKLIERIKDTTIIMDKVRIITSIEFFVMSVVISLFFVLGLDIFLFKKVAYLSLADNFLYILGVGYFIIGMIYFIYSVYELYDLIKRVYRFNANNNSSQFNLAWKEMEKTKQKN